ncbi:MAG: GxxExxY protein [Chitinophagales bacterium]|nr:GxxExxY protein [Chitinophagales bacterium]
MDVNELTYLIRGACFEVHKELGTGLFESVYEAALIFELKTLGLVVDSQIDLPVLYKNNELGLGFRIDILVENKIVLEIKSVESLKNVHKKQLLTYLRLAEKKIGFLVNFNAEILKDKESIIRVIN